GVGGAAHIGLPGVGARFTAPAGLLLAAEGAADLGARRTDVHIGDAAVRAARRQEQLGLAQIIGEDRRRKALLDGVLPCDRVAEIAVFHDIENRREGLAQR